jgi:hypothetical protein
MHSSDVRVTVVTSRQSAGRKPELAVVAYAADTHVDKDGQRNADMKLRDSMSIAFALRSYCYLESMA